MKRNLKDIKEFIILLDKLDELVNDNVVLNNNELDEMNVVLESLKYFIKNGIFRDLESIEEVLIVVDTINGFMVDGVLANPNAMHIVPKQIEVIERILDRNGLLIFVKEAHTKNCVEFNTFPEHCLDGSYESELVKELKPYEQYGITIEKNSTSFMFARGFMNLMKYLKSLKLVIGNGVCGDICIPNGFISLKNYFCRESKPAQSENFSNFIFGKFFFISSNTKYISSSSHSSSYSGSSSISASYTASLSSS